ncbi:alpha/beta hydrolase [Proteiniborus sp. MB09-C3]|uniref:alpha/beta hydrolase n=1 Tax=Proteiniborus sp. MB09-C3 TaxID=3050072 RepID=UPI00255219D1|nr:alpha/beta hydrolase [Proteiniborus sp. MB09-C3]WIV12026.1 alpha/beta hydrolase [Proteiniborus sp. MB09-C3]
MDKLKEKFRTSFFIVNKLYLVLIFIVLAVENLTLGFYYFLISIFIYTWKILNSRIPINVSKKLEPKTFIYKKTKNKDLKLDIWLPSKNKTTTPLVFFCHGGGWISGSRNQPNNVSWCKYLAAKGFAVASIDYRYGYRNTMDDILLDYRDALNYVIKNSKRLSVNKDNIVLMGLSAGGHLSLLYSTYHTYNKNKESMSGIKGVVAYYAPSDINDIFVSENKSIFARFATSQTLKGIAAPKEEIFNYYSPITWISENMIPCLIVHGKLDTTVPFKSSVKFVSKLKEYNIKHTFMVHKKGGHSFDTKLKDMTTVNILEKTARFIRKVM